MYKHWLLEGKTQNRIQHCNFPKTLSQQITCLCVVEQLCMLKHCYACIVEKIPKDCLVILNHPLQK